MPILVNEATHEVNGEPVNGFGWFEWQLPPVLFTVAEGATRLRVECRYGKINRVEGGELTDLGRSFYQALADLGLFQIWSDAPDSRLRFQVKEHWGLVDRAERATAVLMIQTLFTRTFPGVTHFGHAPARH